jgi:hypothetical protein
VLWRSQSPALTRRPGFDPWPLHESLLCTKGSGRGFSPRTLVSPCYCHSPTLHLNTTIVRRTSGRAWELFNRGVLFHVLGRSTLRLFLAAKWHRVLAFRRNRTASTFLADRTVLRRFVADCLLVHVSLLPLPGTQFSLQQIAGRTAECAAVFLSPTHSLTHPRTRVSPLSNHITLHRMIHEKC